MGLRRTPLHAAAAGGKRDTIDALLEAGAGLEEPSFAGLTPLAEAARAGEEAAVRMLLALGASCRCRDSEGATPLHHAGQPWKGQEGSIRALLDAGADLSAADR